MSACFFTCEFSIKSTTYEKFPDFYADLVQEGPFKMTAAKAFPQLNIIYTCRKCSSLALRPKQGNSLPLSSDPLAFLSPAAAWPHQAY